MYTFVDDQLALIVCVIKGKVEREISEYNGILLAVKEREQQFC